MYIKFSPQIDPVKQGAPKLAYRETEWALNIGERRA